jgi:hypothetical protein
LKGLCENKGAEVFRAPLFSPHFPSHDRVLPGLDRCQGVSPFPPLLLGQLLWKKLVLEVTMTMHHPFHFKVAEELQKRLAGRGELIRDSACGGSRHLPLFIGSTRQRDTHMCDVDLIIVSEDKVKVIIEIEESGFLPTKICGKFLQSALATHFIHNSQPGSAILYDKRVLFIQVLDGSKCLKQDTRKDSQGKLIEQKICSILPLKGSDITDYCLFFVGGYNNPVGLESVVEVVLKALA